MVTVVLMSQSFWVTAHRFSPSHPLVCVCVCTCVHTRVYVGIHTCVGEHACVWRPELDRESLPLLLFTLVLETKSLIELEVTDLSRLVSQ